MSHSPSAAEILAAVTARYAAARTYQDSGEQATVYIHGPMPWQRRTTRKVFRSAMERPVRFLFEYKDVRAGPQSGWDVGAMWRDDLGVHAWSYLQPAVRNNLPFEQEVAALTGVSGGTAAFVSKLLMPELGCRSSLPDAEAVTKIDTGRFDGHECHRIDAPARRPAGESLVLWIDKTSALLRGLEEASRFDEKVQGILDESVRAAVAKMAPDDAHRPMMEAALAQRASAPMKPYTTRSTTIWRGRIDGPIEPRAFEFRPPE